MSGAPLTTRTSRAAPVWIGPASGCPARYGDAREEIRAVRERVSIMDVSTLGKFLVAGRDAKTLLDWAFPLDVGAVAPGRARYLLALDEGGYVMDDGLLAALDDGSFYLTSTSGGADRMEAALRNWIDRLDLHVHLVNQTAQLGASTWRGPMLETSSPR
jgi:sarcosine oxidase subunit alpha